jgi:hypothetical protein
VAAGGAAAPPQEESTASNSKRRQWDERRVRITANTYDIRLDGASDAKARASA